MDEDYSDYFNSDIIWQSEEVGFLANKSSIYVASCLHGFAAR